MVDTFNVDLKVVEEVEEDTPTLIKTHKTTYPLEEVAVVVLDCPSDKVVDKVMVLLVLVVMVLRVMIQHEPLVVMVVMVDQEEDPLVVMVVEVLVQLSELKVVAVEVVTSTIVLVVTLVQEVLLSEKHLELDLP